MTKLGKTELAKRIAVSTSESTNMTVLKEHLDRNCSDAEKLANIRNFCEVTLKFANENIETLNNYYTFHYNSVVE